MKTKSTFKSFAKSSKVKTLTSKQKLNTLGGICNVDDKDVAICNVDDKDVAK